MCCSQVLDRLKNRMPGLEIYVTIQVQVFPVDEFWTIENEFYCFIEVVGCHCAVIENQQFQLCIPNFKVAFLSYEQRGKRSIVFLVAEESVIWLNT